VSGAIALQKMNYEHTERKYEYGPVKYSLAIRGECADNLTVFLAGAFSHANGMALIRDKSILLL